MQESQMPESPSNPKISRVTVLRRLKYQRYVQLLADTEYDAWNNKEYAKHLGVSETTMVFWNKKVDWDWIRDQRRKKYAKALRLVDSAMVKKAMKGDVRAAELVYQRFDNWIPASQQFTVHDLDESVIDQELEKLMERKRAVADTISNSARVDNPGSDKTQESGQGQTVPA